jgi:hypothetical protein
MKRSVFILAVMIVGCSTSPTPTYTITTNSNPPEGGSITVSPLQSFYDKGTEVTISNSTNDEYYFQDWSGDISSTNSSVKTTVNSDITVTGNFQKKQYPLYINVVGEGTISEQIIQSKKTDYESGTIVQLTATPSENWVFSSWKGDLNTQFGNDLESSQEVIEVPIYGITNITVTFTKKLYTLNVNVNGFGSYQEKILQAKSTEYSHGSLVQLTSIQSDFCWDFNSWSGDLESENETIEILIDGDKNLDLNFDWLNAYSVPNYVACEQLVGWYPFDGSRENVFEEDFYGKLETPRLIPHNLRGEHRKRFSFDDAFYFDDSFDRIYYYPEFDRNYEIYAEDNLGNDSESIVFDNYALQINRSGNQIYWKKNDFTIAFWAKASDSTSLPEFGSGNRRSSLIYIPTGQAGRFHHIYHENQNTITVRLLNESEYNERYNVENIKEWNHHAITFKEEITSPKSSPVYRYFLNGELIDEIKQYDRNAGWWVGFSQIWIGTSQAEWGINHFEGRIDELGFWQKPLNEAEIKALFNRGFEN